VSQPSNLKAAPKDLVAEACRVYGEAVIARWCVDLLDGAVRYDDPASPPLHWIGGRTANWQLARDPAEEEYWPRVWAARGLRYAWHPSATAAIVSALDDPAWRVREMAAKVVGQRELGEAADALTGLAADPVTRVRVAALRAIGVVGEAEHAGAVHEGLSDPEPGVRRAADRARQLLRRRLDRDL
jgi:hypothetical protein